MKNRILGAKKNRMLNAKKKQILSAVLALAMVLAVFPMSALSQSFDAAGQHSTAGQITAAGQLEAASTLQRDVILMLDISDSMAGIPLAAMKQAAIKFCDDIMKSVDDNRIGLVIWDYYSSTYDFSGDVESVKKKISDIKLGEGTKTDQALRAAKNQMDSNGRAGAEKNIVLMTDGLPTFKEFNGAGPYTSSDYPGSNWDGDFYACANSAYNEALSIMARYSLYSLGFFHSATGNDIEFGSRFLNDIQNSGYYEVTDPDELIFLFGNVASDINSKSRKGQFKYPGDGRDRSATYYYDDAYFKQSSNIYNERLATMSLCFQLSSWGSEEKAYANRMDNAENLLTEIGFTGFDSNYTSFSKNDVIGKPTMDSIGVVAANKKINHDGKDYTLIAVAVRGGGYESEWASNFTIGSSGQHQGFREARDQVIKFLHTYINSQRITGDIKLWITGYSRGGATANLVAGAIDEGKVKFAGCPLALKDLYAYTFATPLGTEAEKGINKGVFENIHNIVSPNDPVTKVAPEAWKFSRYGVDHPIPTPVTQSEKMYKNNYDNMIRQYNELEGAAPYVIDGFKWHYVNVDYLAIARIGEPDVDVTEAKGNNKSQSVFLDQFIAEIAQRHFEKRENYVKTYQKGIRNICDLVFGGGKSKAEKFIALATNKIKWQWGWVAYEAMHGGIKKADGKVGQYLKDSLRGAGIAFSETVEFLNSLESLLGVLAYAALSNPLMTITMVMNMERIMQAHRPEVYLAWMQSEDVNYTPGGMAVFLSAKYRVVKINCPVDVKVYNDENTLVASIVADVPQEVSSIVSALNEDGEKVVYLPATDDYTVELAATGDGSMSYSLHEYNPQAGGINRLVNYFDVPIKSGQKFVGEIPAYSAADLENQTAEASATGYTLSTEGDAIVPSSDMSGDEATSAYFEVDIASEDIEMGFAFGGGIRQFGTYALVKAEPYPGSNFVGWYENGEALVSEDAEYRFRVMADVALVARFSYDESASNEIVAAAGAGGAASSPAPWANPFADVYEEDWFYEAVKYAHQNGLVSGTSATTFSPHDTLTRAMLVTILWNHAGQPRTGSSAFDDVEGGIWYADAVNWAAANGVVAGYGDGLFGPDDEITREQMAVMLHNYAKFMGAGLPRKREGAFVDDGLISPWAKEAVGDMYAAEVLNGKGENNFDPQGEATRAEVVAMMRNFLENIITT